MKTDVRADKMTRERTEGAAKAVQTMHGDGVFANRVEPDSNGSAGSGDDCIGRPALSCSMDNALVDNGAAAPKSCLSPLAMRSPITADGLLPTGKTSTAIKALSTTQFFGST